MFYEKGHCDRVISPALYSTLCSYSGRNDAVTVYIFPSLFVLFLSTLVTMISYAYLILFVTEYDLMIFNKYSRSFYDDDDDSLSNSTSYDLVTERLSSGELSMPPKVWIMLEIGKATGAFYALAMAKIIFSTCLWIRFEVKFETPEDKENIVAEATVRAHLHIASKMPSSMFHRSFIEFFVVMHEFFDEASMTPILN